MSDFSIFNPKKSEKSDENQDAGGLQFHVDHPDPVIRRVRRRGARLFRTFSLRYFDFLLVFLIVTLNIIGILAIGSAEPEYQSRQITGMIASLVVMVLAAGMDYRRILHFGWFYYFVAIAALLAVRFMGDTGGGAQRWVTIGPLRFQPSEMAKVLIILFYAFFINKYKERVRTAPVTLMGIALIVPPLILVISQPDLSTTIMIFIIFCVIMFVGGINWKLVVGVLVVSVPSAAVLFNMILQDTEGKILDTYQRNRILAWIYPDQYQDSYAYQTINSVMAIGSGRLLGKGYNTNEISSLLNSGYISESQTDFIFAVIGEEFGFLGTCIVVLLVFLIALRILRIAMKASDVSGRVIAAGMAAWIGFQGFMNIAVAVGLIPNTGIPLPFVSYGLTSLLSLYLGVGFVLNVYMQGRKR